MKTAGRMLGFGLISTGLIGIFGPSWLLITSIIAVGLFLAREMLATGLTKIRAWWSRRSSTTPTAGAAPEKSKVPKWIKYPAWIVILAGLILEGYREWDILAGWSWDFKGIADKAIAEKIVFSDVSGSAIDLKKFKSKNTRYFRVRIRPDKDTYWGTCADGEIFEGISIQNERIREKFSRTADLTDGNIVVQGDSGSPTRDGGLVYIHEKTPQVFLDVRKKGHPGCKTDAPLTADIQFVAENP